ncbi:MAG: CHAT domain-containing protein, partial [Theionarchaea archaeon]|nr:CHAT domain-containing protein [Theionarchaea archaeon]
MSMQPRILCLFSTPLVSPNNNPLDILDVDEECRAVIESLEECNYQVLLRLRFATVNNLAEGVRDDFNILHISCHGNENTLLFEDGKSGSQPLTGDYLKKLFSRKRLFKLVILSACHSEAIAEKLVEAGVEHVISIRRDTPVLDRAATVFVHHFYAYLFRGDTVEEAFEMAKLLVEGDPDLMKMRPQLEFIAEKKGESFVPEEDKFLLLPRDSSHFRPLSVEFLEGAVDTDKCPLPETNLPVRPQSFTGRSSDMHVIIEKIFTNRLVTITGTGGIGKTTLAREVARWFHLRGHFPDGIFSIDLRQVENAEGIIALLGAALEAPFAEPQDVVEYLRERQYLLLLDNAEDVLSKDEGRVRDLIDQILMFAPKIKFLITSQTSLGGILHEPEFVHRLYTLEQLHAFLLFYRTKRREMSEEELKSDEFYHLLDQLGGHPLSIVLMARQLIHGTTLKDLLDRIKKYKAEAIRVRTIIDRDPEHGESLATSLISAYNRLSDNAQTLFEILSLLPAGGEDFVLKDIFGDTAWEYAQELNDASLAEITFKQRVVLLPPVRLFAVSILKEETKELYGPKIVEIMEQYAVTCYENLGTKDAVVYRFLFTMEEPNFRSAIELPSSPPKTKKEISYLGSLSYKLILLYNFHYRYQEAREGGDAMISNLRNLQDQLGEAYTLQALGDLAVRIDDLKDGKEKYEEALSIFQEIGDNLGTAYTLQALGDLAVRISDLKDGKEKYEEALSIFQEIGDNLGTANTLKALGDLAVRIDDLKDGKEKYEEALSIFQEIGSNLGTANTLKALGDLAVRISDLKDGKEKYEEALSIFQEIGSNLGTAYTLKALGDLAVRISDLKDGKEKYEEALSIFQEIGSNLGTANTLKALGDLAVRIDDLKDGKEKYEEALSIFQEIGDNLGTANTLQALGDLAVRISDLKDGKEKYEEALSIFQEIGDNLGTANTLKALG